MAFEPLGEPTLLTDLQGRAVCLTPGLVDGTVVVRISVDSGHFADLDAAAGRDALQQLQQAIAQGGADQAIELMIDMWNPTPLHG